MAILTEYFAPDSLQRLQNEFVLVLRVPVRICSPEGQWLTEDSPIPAPEGGDVEFCGPVAGADVPIELEGLPLGRLVVKAVEGAPASARPASPSAMRLLHLMANVIARRWNRQRILRTRMNELDTVYRLAAEFAQQDDLQSLLDLVAQTVVKVLRAKACSIRLLSDDHTELVIRAVANLSAEYLQKGRILLERSQIDREALATNDCIYIADEQTDPRVLYPAEARREGLVSALCAPMSYQGRAEGVIHVYTAQPHQFDWFETSLLRSVASQAAAAIAHARHDEEAARSANAQRQLDMAAEVQQHMIPAEAPAVPGLDIGAVYVPSVELSGDFYDFIPLPAGRLGVAICDVAGKGVRASLLMASTRAMLHSCAALNPDISEVIARVNRQLCADTLSSDFATMFYAAYEPETRRLTYVNAGHVPPILVRQGEFCHLTTGGMVLGIEPDRPWDCDAFVMHPGDVIVAYTDGLSEAINFADEPFGLQRVQKAVATAIEAGYTAEGIAKHCLWDMRRFAGLHVRFDDTTIVAMRVL